MTDRIGWIGLGAMGGAMAKRVADAGFPIIVHDLRAEAMAPFAARAARSRRGATQQWGLTAGAASAGWPRRWNGAWAAARGRCAPPAIRRR